MKTKQQAFTLVELVVVILILGILAGVAAPKFFDTSKTATDNGIKQTLSIVRDAIELYAANNAGNLPPSTSTTQLHTELEDFIRGTFPASPVGAQNNLIENSSDDPLTATASATEGWKYNATTGEFICNSNAVSGDGTTKYEEF